MQRNGIETCMEFGKEEMRCGSRTVYTTVFVCPHICSMADCLFAYLGRIAHSLCSQCIVFYGDCGYGFVFIENLNNLKSIRNVRWNTDIIYLCRWNGCTAV